MVRDNVKSGMALMGAPEQVVVTFQDQIWDGGNRGGNSLFYHPRPLQTV
jgi:hypothetical protein